MPKKTPLQPAKLFFIRDDSNYGYRVWSENDFGDVFLVLDCREDIHTIFKKLCEYHSHTLTYGAPDEE